MQRGMAVELVEHAKGQLGQKAKHGKLREMRQLAHGASRELDVQLQAAGPLIQKGKPLLAAFGGKKGGFRGKQPDLDRHKPQRREHHDLKKPPQSVSPVQIRLPHFSKT